MLIPEKYKKYTAIPEDCPKYDKSNPDYRCSVIYDRSNYRINTVETEAQKNTYKALIWINESIGYSLAAFYF